MMKAFDPIEHIIGRYPGRSIIDSLADFGIQQRISRQFFTMQSLQRRANRFRDRFIGTCIDTLIKRLDHMRRQSNTDLVVHDGHRKERKKGRPKTYPFQSRQAELFKEISK